MKIMLCNDDGINAEGINVLHNQLIKEHEVCVIAPEKEMSGAGSSITTKRPLFPIKIKENFIAINGTPVDCVHLGLNQLCPFEPDLLLSGINYGANMAEDLLYSGTVGAAMEGREFSIPSIAISAAAFIQPGSEGKSGSRNPTYLAKNPAGTIPCIEEPGSGFVSHRGDFQIRPGWSIFGLGPATEGEEQ